jgi:hypothetical protein
MKRLSISLAGLMALTGVAGAASSPHRYVMVVAHNQSNDPGVKALRYADDDGVRYFEFFKLSTDRVALFSVLDDETARLFPVAARAAKPPTAEAVFGTLSRWFAEMETDRKAGRTTELLFVYAGHGDVDKTGEGYVNLLGSKLRRRDLYQKVLAASKADYVHLIIDACKSYFLVNRRGGEDWKDDSASESHDAEIRAFLNREDLSSYPRVGVILATSGDQSTHEWTRYRGGILSHGLRSALTGSADINGDGRVEYSETHAFLAASTARVRHPEARLNIWARPPAANRHQPLFDLRDAQRARLLRFAPTLSGKFYLEDDRGIRYADMNKAPGTRVDMAVDRKRTYFIHSKSSEAKINPGAGRIQVATLSFTDKKLAMRGSVETSFRKDLYKLAYSRGFYDGFCARTGLEPVEGGAVEFMISRPGGQKSGGKLPSRHHLTVGYIVTSALLDLEGASHGVQLGYEFGLHRHVTVGATMEFSRSGHQNPQDEDFSLTRFAALGGVTARTPLFRRVTVRAELLLGYQGYFGSGPVYLNKTNVGESSDSMGFRMEAGLGARVDLTSFLFADLRGGLGVELVTLERKGETEEHAHTAPFGALGVGARF